MNEKKYPSRGQPFDLDVPLSVGGRVTPSRIFLTTLKGGSLWQSNVLTFAATVPIVLLTTRKVSLN